ncbi:hypothetical protein TCAL_01131 [Tigriopus californicus]|uniref:Protein THEM6 n=1 Tax=Tigriopus californicus TaxID=6832 RepID=A0A553P507_TIGCA|nr:protein THEM6-like [Tigriopus californicus]TRY72710.1 hypothetical protein TCAL_01131 [Tigriopus californicus]|eukprot:TCALIF_01131-PA protein Name:"Similar to CG4666 Protein THEM6 (Drosophila melanogaster)" AED:0.06 eAED:0.06 QI:0/0/0/1/1/1/2/0/209
MSSVFPSNWLAQSAGILAGSCVLLASFDVFYFLRVASFRISSLFQSPMTPADEGSILSFCGPNDIDIYLHMNNSRYMREMDFGRYDFYFRSGLAKYIGEHRNLTVVQHAALIRYRRSIDFLMRFHLKTKLIWFDERALYFEQRFISKHDGFVRAVALCKNTFVNSEDMIKVMTEHFNIPLPICPPYLESFIKSNEESSLALKEEMLQLS